MMAYKTEMERYLAYSDRIAKFIVDYYDCQITYPRNVRDINNTIDGIKIKFNKLDWSFTLTNFCLYQITKERGAQYSSAIKTVKKYIENSLISKIRKY